MLTIQQLLQYAVEKGASDLHIVAGRPAMVKIDGELIAVPGETEVTPTSAEQLISGTVSAEQKQILTVNKELDFSFTVGEVMRFRVNVYYQKGSMAACFRVIPGSIQTVEELGLPAICHAFANLKQGFVLVTGPTGHGKSTTLAAILQEINKNRAVHIVTIEDPIEFIYNPVKAIVSQREVHGDTHSWEIALRSVLREDPDVVLVGEMRDFETISQALTVAETGHLVFATLHTNSAAQTVDRIVDVFPENQQAQVRMQLSSTLEAVVSQRLVPRIGGGRAVACEVMLGSSAVKTAIRESRTHTLDNIVMTSAEAGMLTLEASLAQLVRSGAISAEMARGYSLRQGDMDRLLKGGA